MDAVLVLNSDYQPHEVISWQKAMSKLFINKVEQVEEYEGRQIRTATRVLPFPAVVRKTTGYARRRVRLSRKNIHARDHYTCQYCGIKPRKSTGTPDLSKLTIDHVVPRSRTVNGWVTLPWNGERVKVGDWMNVLSACSPCNARKANRTPGEAGMHMRKKPKVPSNVDLAWMNLFKYEIPDEWKQYLPEDSPWREYWDVELVP